MIRPLTANFVFTAFCVCDDEIIKQRSQNIKKKLRYSILYCSSWSDENSFYAPAIWRMLERAYSVTLVGQSVPQRPALEIFALNFSGGCIRVLWMHYLLFFLLFFLFQLEIVWAMIVSNPTLPEKSLSYTSVYFAAASDFESGHWMHRSICWSVLSFFTYVLRHIFTWWSLWFVFFIP